MTFRLERRIIALILRYFTKFHRLALLASYVTVVEDSPNVCRISSSTFGRNWPIQQSHGLSAIAELLYIVQFGHTR